MELSNGGYATTPLQNLATLFCMASMDGFSEGFGRRQREARESADMSMSELARRMEAQGWPKYHAATVSRTESGDRTPRLDEAVALARVLETSLDSLAGLELSQATHERLIEGETFQIHEFGNETVEYLGGLLIHVAGGEMFLRDALRLESIGTNQRAACDQLKTVLDRWTLQRLILGALDRLVEAGTGEVTVAFLQRLADQLEQVEKRTLSEDLRLVARIYKAAPVEDERHALDELLETLATSDEDPRAWKQAVEIWSKWIDAEAGKP